MSKSLRIVDDDSVVDVDDVSGGGWRIDSSFNEVELGKTMADAGRFIFKSVELINGLFDVDTDDFLNNGELPIDVLWSYLWRYSSVLNLAVGIWEFFVDCWSTNWINNSVKDLKQKDRNVNFLNE